MPLACAARNHPYDTLRVTDPSLRPALTALFADRFEGLSTAPRERAVAAVDVQRNDDRRVRALCAKLVALGPPEYQPTYMVAHGPGAVLGESEEPPVREIDQASGWKKALTFVNCPTS